MNSFIKRLPNITTIYVRGVILTNMYIIKKAADDVYKTSTNDRYNYSIYETYPLILLRASLTIPFPYGIMGSIMWPVLVPLLCFLKIEDILTHSYRKIRDIINTK